jgi:hypothetical protein
MPKKTFTGLALIILLIVSSQALLNSYTLSVSAAEPSKLKIYVGPASVLADKGDYEIILVQLQDSKNAPARALEDTTISLSSSQTNIGTVEPSINIPKGSTQATAKFYSTYTPGTTKITAASTGYLTVEASVTTVGPMPSMLAVYGFPPVLPADGDSYNALVVQLQDSGGSPAKAPIGSVQVSLSSSNNTIAAVPSSVTIEAGNTYATTTIQTTPDATGSAVITAIASGYSSKQTTITTRKTATTANTLKIYIGPPKVLAEGKSFNQILVQLQNASGNIAQVTSNVTVTLSSSKTDVGTVDPTIIIPASKTYATAKFTSTYLSGTTTIIAAATDYTTDTEPLTTVGPIPSKLAVYCLPSALPADNQQYKAIQVQLQDAQGKPAKDPEGDVNVNLFSSEPEAGTVTATLTIPFGETYATGTFSSTCTANTTTITAQTSGYESGQAKMTTYLIDQYTLTVSITAYPNSVNSSEQTTIEVYVTYDSLAPASGATIRLASDNRGNFSSITDEKNGYYQSIFTAPNVTTQTVCTISANASKTGYTTGHGSVQVAVNSNVGFGSLRLYVKETGDIPISGASIISISQPSGMSSISAITDNEGYVSFDNALAGTYTLQISKEGYDTKEEIVVVTAVQTTNTTVYVTKASSSSDLTLTLLIVTIIVVAVAIGLTAIVIIRKRKQSTPQYGYIP